MTAADDPSDMPHGWARRDRRRSAGNGHARAKSSNGSGAQNSAAKSAVEFLEKLRPGGPWVLTSIYPDKGWIDTITAKTHDEVRAFIGKWNGKRNLYYSVNPTRKEMTSKAAKTDIAAIEYILSDLDPNEGETSEAAKARYLAKLATHQPIATAVVDSGNGIQGLWRLAEPILLPDDAVIKTNADGELVKVLSEATAKLVDDVEARIKALMETMGSVAGTQNIDRILRLPGTTNLPDAKKRKDGRVECPTKLISFNGATCALEDFPAAEAKAEDAPTGSKSLDWDKVAEHAGWLKTIADLPSNFNAKGKLIVAHHGSIEDLNEDLKQAGHEPYKSKWSSVSFALTAIFKADGRYTREQIAAALLCDLHCNQHVTKLKYEAQRRRTVERLLTRSHEVNGAAGRACAELAGVQA